MIKQSIVIIALASLTSGCSNEDFYKTLQPNLFSCQKIPSMQRDECNEGVFTQMTYDEYEKERKKLSK